jgi:hypothetical protein
MTVESTPIEEKDKKVQVQVQNNSLGSVYGLGVVGAWIFYFSRAATPEEKLKAFFKGLVWPATLVKALLEFFEQK